MNKRVIYPYLLLSFLYSCASSYKTYNPDKKFSQQQLREDYTLLRNILETKHPSLYWYTPKDSMNFYFDSLYNAIPDSMTELQFGWRILAPLTNKIRCGHTSFSMSKNWNRFIANKRIPAFPLFLKVWGDSMMVVANLNRQDSIFKTGTLVTSINGIQNHEMLQQMFQYLPLDGYSDNVNYIRISGNFPYYHRSIFGIYKNYRVGYIDSTGTEKSTIIPMWVPPVDTGHLKKPRAPGISRKQRKKERRESFRNMVIDTANSTATINLNTFSTGGGKRLRHFIKHSFRQIKKQECKHLVIDLRSNGGGDITMSSLLARYIRKTPFKVADSAYAITKCLSPYTYKIKEGILNNLGLFFLTSKRKDGNYHFGYYERKTIHPKKKNHFDGEVYVLINGPTFSASTLFTHTVKGQDNVLVVGEEAGGGWYGNNGIMIPDIVLPITKLRVRLPIFRIVQYNHIAKDGRGVMPDVYIPPMGEAIKNGIDRKMLWIMDRIKSQSN